MNFLAHAYLARHDDNRLLGGLAGDFVRGNASGQVPEGWLPGVALHRFIDGQADRHPALIPLKASMTEPGLRRVGAIVLDVTFDHLLAVDFDQWFPPGLGAFSRRVYRLLEMHQEELPPASKGFLTHLRRSDLFGRYRDRETVALALKAIERRFSRPTALGSAPAWLREHEQNCRDVFPEFFDDMQRRVGDWLKRSV